MFLDHGVSVSADSYYTTLKYLKGTIRNRKPGMLPQHEIPFHGNTRPYGVPCRNTTPGAVLQEMWSFTIQHGHCIYRRLPPLFVIHIRTEILPTWWKSMGAGGCNPSAPISFPRHLITWGIVGTNVSIIQAMWKSRGYVLLFVLDLHRACHWACQFSFMVNGLLFGRK
jgi:hypothetical protein